MKTEKVYKLPVRKVDFVQALSDPKIHNGKTEYAVDFDLSVGTPIIAAQSGQVTEVYMESDEGGEDEKYLNNINKYTNRITIKHAENEYSQYAHLQHDSAEVKEGDEVKVGQVIAHSGNTGFSTQPHLHFHVMQIIEVENEKDWESLEIRWKSNFDILGCES